MQCKPRLQIPVVLAQYIIVNRLEKPFQAYLYLLMATDGIIHEKSPVIGGMPNRLEKDVRTIKKTISLAISLNWVGYDQKSGLYYIRGLNRLVKQYNLCGKKAATFATSEILNLKGFLVAAVITEKINRRKAAAIFARKKSKSATVNRDVALQDWAFPGRDYFGVSLAEISDTFKCSHGQAYNLKSVAERANYIIVNKKFNVITTLSTHDYHMKKYVEDISERGGKKLRFQKSNGKILVLEQQIDELIPRVRLIRVQKFKL